MKYLGLDISTNHTGVVLMTDHKGGNIKTAFTISPTKSWNVEKRMEYIADELAEYVENLQVDKVVIEGNSNVFLGVMIGFLIGSITFTAIMASYDDEKSLIPGIEGGEVAVPVWLGIVALGTAIGIITSTPDEIIEPFSEEDLSGLSAYSKYPFEEPEDLRKIK